MQTNFSFNEAAAEIAADGRGPAANLEQCRGFNEAAAEIAADRGVTTMSTIAPPSFNEAAAEIAADLRYSGASIMRVVDASMRPRQRSPRT